MAADDRAQSALTGVFAAGSPPLLETLRTLSITPRRYATPGETIRVEFEFSNLGGAAATGVRVRICAPSGVTYVEGSDTVDGQPQASGARLVAPEGAPAGDLPANMQRQVACSFRVHDRIENGTELIFQAAVATDQTQVIASNVQRLTVRSEPVLQNSSTFVTIAAPDNPKPGDVLTIRATIANTGASSAHDVLAILPVPEHTRYVVHSARVAGRALLNVGDEPFDYAAETIVAERLAPGQTMLLEYQTEILAPLDDGTRIKVSGAISSREVAEFAVQSAEIVASSPIDFSTEETALTVFCDDVVTPGSRVPITFRALNAGTGGAKNVSMSFELPPGLFYTQGSAHIDGQPVGDDAFAGQAFSLGSLPAGRAVEVGISAIVAVASGDELTLPIATVLRWKGGPSTGSGEALERRFTRTIRVRVSSRFTRARNYIDVDRAVVQSREDVTFTAHVFNDGTAAEPDVRLRVIPGAFLDDVRIAESPDEPVAYAEPFSLGIVQPHAERRFTIRARIASPVPDRSQVTLGAVLEFGSGSFDLGVASVVVRSRAHVAPEGCTWERVQSEALRPGQAHEVLVRFTNDGSDVLRDARLDLRMPPELVLDRAQNARRAGSSLHFGDVAAQTTHEARVTIRLLRAPRGDRMPAIEGTLCGRGISPLHFEPLDVPTFAQPQFESGALLRSNPSESVEAGERVAYEIHLRNSGDGPAERLVVRAIPSNLAVYIPASTTLNGIAIPDDLGTSQLWSQRGLVLTDVNPGVELRIHWELAVISPLAQGTVIDTRAVVEWDGDQSLALAAPALRVISTPSLEAGSAGTPISVAQILPSLETPPLEAIVPPQAEEVVQKPRPAQASPPTLLPMAPPTAPTLYVDYTPDRLVQIIRMLEKGNAGGLIAHLFALRAFFPNAIAGADEQLAQTLDIDARDVRAPLDRFFVRISMPRLTITAKDLEDRDSRFALRGFMNAVIDGPIEPAPERLPGVVRLRGSADRAALRRRIAELEQAPLGSIVPWIVNAQLLGSHIESDASESDVLALYRAEVLKVFGVLETLPMPEFHRVLASSVNRTLDDALGAVLEVLRAAPQLVAD